MRQPFEGKCYPETHGFRQSKFLHTVLHCLPNVNLHFETSIITNTQVAKVINFLEALRVVRFQTIGGSKVDCKAEVIETCLENGIYKNENRQK